MHDPDLASPERDAVDLHRIRVRMDELERSWRNLNQTVPPHAQDWWDRNMASHRERFLDLRKRVDAASPNEIPSIEDELRELEGLCAEAGAKLGERTAAGRAKAE